MPQHKTEHHPDKPPGSRIDPLRLPRPSSRAERLWAAQHHYAPYLFVAPFVVLFLCFMLYPLARSFVLSFYNTIGPRSYRFVGIGNYKFLLQDQFYGLALANTLGYAAAIILLQVPLSLGLALLLNSRHVRFRNTFRFAFFTPHLVGGVFVAVIFGLLLAKNGPVNEFLGNLTGRVPNWGWTTDPILARFAVIIAALWLSVGFGMIYFLAALQSVDRELYEAADVDGAGPWSKFWNVTIPGIKPVLVFMILVGTIGSLQLFELPFILFGQSTGPGLAGLTIVAYLFQAGFQSGNIGYASAVGWTLVVLIATISVIQLKVTRATKVD